MNSRTLVHEFGHDQPNTTKELLNIATGHTSGEEAVGSNFIRDSGRAAPGGDRGTVLKTSSKGAKRYAKGDKRELNWWPWWVVVTTSCNEGDNDKEVGDSNEELIAAAEHDFRR
jgi:hypothetical protein